MNNNQQKYPVVTIVRNPADAAASESMILWAAGRLAEVLASRGIGVNEVSQIDQTAETDYCILLSGSKVQPARDILQQLQVIVADGFESYGLVKADWNNRAVLVAAGADSRGLMYAILELADRVKYAADPIADLQTIDRIIEKSLNPVRSIKRVFSSEIEDKPWFYDESFWLEYLTELTTQRLNKFNLTLGMGIDNGHDPDLSDNYFCFAYPFFVDVPGYDVKAKRLPVKERELNLKMLRFISAEAKRRGIHFQLALWTHAYQLVDCFHENYVIEGLNPDNHAAYCRDALRLLLQACPAIDGVTLRVHYESGIPEPAHEFWKTVFEAFTDCGRRVEIDLHAKGVDEDMIQLAVDTGMPVLVSAKYHAEHLALPYHQAAIRDLELPDYSLPSHTDRTVTSLGRRHTRYGYADFLKEDRKYGLIYRIFPGTQRLLLWGDPVMAAGYGRNGVFCGSQGIELMEPLTYKARKDTGYPGGRDVYADPALKLGISDWKKYEYYYRLWGRLLFNPDTDPEVWRRYLRHEFAEAAEASEQALGFASRILPLVTVSHLPSAAHNVNWTEMHTNMPILESDKPLVYGDTPSPKTFNFVSPLDPAMFYRIDDYAEDLVQNRISGKYSPGEVADRLDSLALQAEQYLNEAVQAADSGKPSFRRLAVDVAAQVGIGRFFARKFRAAVAYALFERTGKAELLEQAIAYYRSAKEAWEQVALATKDAYREDITFGFKNSMRGHWEDRLAIIEEDILAMEQIRENVKAVQASTVSETAVAVEKSLSRKASPLKAVCQHTAPAAFKRGEPVKLQITVSGNDNALSVSLHYSHVNQAEGYQIVKMLPDGQQFEATIPGEFTDSVYPLLYFFELKNNAGEVWRFPGLDEDLSNLPYFVVREQR